MDTTGKAFLLRFAQAAAVRALRTFAQTAAATIVASGAGMLSGVDWKACLSVSALAAVNSVLTSVASGLPEMKLPPFPDTDGKSS